ncbi:formyltransferase family protein (plasmid) [Pseudoalteromonas sp. T1lg65]|uniref:formyltransferase family protein n=1 Tax=Pseudoalteromonas sp. T1lg65 TaxID=2077101 RepID=UPI003F7AE67C
MTTSNQPYAFFSGTCQSIPAISFLQQQGLLACVVLPNDEANPDVAQLAHWVQQQQIPVFCYREGSDAMLCAELNKLNATRGLLYQFNQKIQPTCLAHFAEQLFVIHPGALPTYRGKDALYWQVRNGESHITLTLYRATEKIGYGDIANTLNVDVHPFEGSSAVSQKLSQACVQLIHQFIQLDAQRATSWQPQIEESSRASLVKADDLSINWSTQSSVQIANMARAGNAVSYVAQFQVQQGWHQLMQATAVTTSLFGIPAGTIIELDKHNGLVVKTQDSALRLDIIGTQHGLFDGYRFAVLFRLEAGMSLLPAITR